MAAAALAPRARSHPRPSRPGPARLTARPGSPAGGVTPGRSTLGLGADRDGLLLVPQRYDPAVPGALILALHGATQDAARIAALLGPSAEEAGYLLLAVDSRQITWDAIRGSYGPDVAFIDRALAQTFARCRVDPAKVFVAGFSDGATYALGLGLANGDLFRRIVAFSPGFIPDADPERVGKPGIFISHGGSDHILPVTGTRLVIVPLLRQDGYAVTYREFDGGHEVPPAVARAAMRWLR